MFLTDKYSSLLPPHHHHSDAAAPPKSSGSSSRRRHKQQLVAGSKAASFDAALTARLRSLLPLPASSSTLAALARLADLLALTLAEAAPALAGEGDASAVAAHLDAGVALLDACNAITARLDRLRRRRLLARFALHLLASPSADSGKRARAALADGGSPASSPPPPPLPSLPFDQPRGRLSAAARVLVAVNAVSSLAAASAAAVLEGGAPATAFPRVSGAAAEFPWAEPFNAVSSQLEILAASNASEVHAIDTAVQRLASVLDSGSDEAALRAAAQEVEKRTEELTARLDRLSDAVSGVFRAALGLRNAELGSFMAGPADKTRI